MLVHIDMNANDVEEIVDEQVSEIGRALAHPVRVRILRLLAQGERCGCELEPLFAIDQSGISRHLNALRRAGLVSPRREGVRVYWRLSDPKVRELLALLEKIGKSV